MVPLVDVQSIFASVLVISLTGLCFMTMLLSPYTISIHLKEHGRFLIGRAQARQLMEKYVLYRAIQYAGRVLMLSLVGSAIGLLVLAIVNQRHAI